MNHWLIKSEPFAYSWNEFVAQGIGTWDGVRNYQARNNLMAMKLNDLALFYHSNEGMEVVGIAKVVQEHFPDPTTDDTRWVAVRFQPVAKLVKTVTLKQIKADEKLSNMALIKLSRLSVSPVTAEEFDWVLKLGEMSEGSVS